MIPAIQAANATNEFAGYMGQGAITVVINNAQPNNVAAAQVCTLFVGQPLQLARVAGRWLHE